MSVLPDSSGNTSVLFSHSKSYSNIAPLITKELNKNDRLHMIYDEKTLETLTHLRPFIGSSCQALKHAVSALFRFDDFISETLANGFFSEVYKVTHKVTGEVMVLKKNLIPSNKSNMLKEVQLIKQLSHPNIIKFLGVCVQEGQLHALIEYINGGSLEQLLSNKSVDLSWNTRINIALDVSNGMEYLHSQSMMHRDLTSKNILIKRGHGKITAIISDFGLATCFPHNGVQLPTVGSPYWMSPECLKGKYYDQRTDVFSYGVVLCEIIARIEADPDILPRTESFGLDSFAFIDMCEDCPQEFLELALICCSIDPNKRPDFKEIVLKLKCCESAMCQSISECDYPRSISPDGQDLSVSSDNVSISKYPGKLAAIMKDDFLNFQISKSPNPFASLSRFKDGKKVLEVCRSSPCLSCSEDVNCYPPCDLSVSSVLGSDDHKPFAKDTHCDIAFMCIKNCTQPSLMDPDHSDQSIDWCGSSESGFYSVGDCTQITNGNGTEDFQV